jgi:zinc protease
MRPVTRTLCCSLCLLALAAGIRGQDGQWKLGPEPQRLVLANGLTVISQTDDSCTNSVVQLLVRGGSRDDPGGLSGLAYLTMRLALEIPDQTKLRQLMDFGSSFSLHVGEDYSLITIRALSRHLEPTLEILSAIFNQPLFSGLRIDGIKEQMRYLQNKEADEPAALMRARSAESFFGSEGYGARLFGDEASLATIGKKDVQEFFNAHFAAANMVAVIVSDLGPGQLKPMIERLLGRLPAGKALPSPPPQPARTAPPAVTVARQSAQTLVASAALLPALDAENFVLASLLESWLGKGIGCKLWPLREQSDLTYGVNAEVLPLRDAMLLTVYLRTGSGRADEAQKNLMHILNALYENGVGEEELSASRAYAQADFWRENESRERRAATLAFMEGMGLSYRLGGDFHARLGAVQPERLNRFIREWLAPARWLGLRIGPQ